MTNQERQTAIKRNQEIERRKSCVAAVESFLLGIVVLAVAISATLAVIAGMASKIY